MSASHRAKISAAAKARWAKVKKVAVKAAPKAKGGMSAAGRREDFRRREGEMGEGQGSWPQIIIIESPAGWLLKRLRPVVGERKQWSGDGETDGTETERNAAAESQTEARRFFGTLLLLVTSACLAKLNGLGRAGIAPTKSPGSVAKNALVTATSKSPKVANNHHIIAIIVVNGELHALYYSSLVTI